MIIRLQNIGFAVRNVTETWNLFRGLFGLEGWQEAPDETAGIERAVSMPFPNDCALYLMESKLSASPVGEYLAEKGPGLERLTFLSDDIHQDYDRISGAGIPVVADKIIADQFGKRIFIERNQAFGMTIELRQPNHPVNFGAYCNPNGILGIQHIGTACLDIHAVSKKLETILGKPMLGIRSDQHESEQYDGWIEPGNDHLILHPTQSWGENARVRHFIEGKGEGLEHISIEVADIRAAVRRVTSCGAAIHENKIYTNREDGFEAFIFPEYTTGMTVELIEPHPDSRYYRHHQG
jgi:4-hydroxyphenylpyruvate dioxygenase-like putative hemolysin